MQWIVVDANTFSLMLEIGYENYEYTVSFFFQVVTVQLKITNLIVLFSRPRTKTQTLALDLQRAS
jgi:hypothetical protein